MKDNLGMRERMYTSNERQENMIWITQKSL